MEGKDLQSVISADFFEKDSVGGELDSVIGVLERHGYPLEMRQVKAIAFIRAVCPESELLEGVLKEFERGTFKAMDPGLFLEALDKWNLADKVMGKIPLNKMFNGGNEK